MKHIFGFFFLLWIPFVLQGQDRLRPPDLIQCDRNQLTSFSGKVQKLQRTKEKVSVAVETDQGIKEFSIQKTDKQGALKNLLLNGSKFQKEDWKKIVEEKKVKEGISVIVWVCANEKNPYFDWQLPEDAPEGVD